MPSKLFRFLSASSQPSSQPASTKAVLWIINHYASSPSGKGSTRHFSLAHHIAHEGWKTCVLTSQNVQEKDAHCHVTFVTVPSLSYKANGVRRLLGMLLFSLKVLVRAPRLLPRPHVVMGSTVHPFAAFVAWVLARCYRAAFVYEIRDVWPQTLVDMGALSERHPLCRLFAWMDRFLAQRAGAIVSPLPFIHHHVAAFGVSQDRCFFLPNGIEPESSFHQPLACAVTPHASSTGRPFCFFYVGSFSQAYGLENLLDAMVYVGENVNARGTNPIELHCVGDGPCKEALERKSRELGLQKAVFFHPSQPKVDLAGVLEPADAFVVSHDAMPVFRYGIGSNKIAEYMAWQRPIVFVGSQTLTPLAQNAFGICVPPRDARKVAEAFEEMAALPLTERLKMAQAARAFALKELAYPQQAKKLLAFFSAERLVTPPRTAR